MAEEEEEAPATQASDQVDKSAEAAGSLVGGITLKKSSSRDYSRVICETLTYTSSEEPSAEQKKLNSGRIERQGSIRNTNASNRYVPPSSKRGYLSHHLLGCFPSRTRRSSLHIIPKLVLADEINRSGAVAVAAVSGFRCGSTKGGGGPAFSRVPADAARGSYSEPTSPQVTCIGQVKASRSKHAGTKNSKYPTNSKCPNSKLPPPNPNSSACIRSNSLLLRSTSNNRRGSVSSPLSASSPARGFARSNSRRRDGEDDVLANVSTSFEIDLTRENEEGEATEGKVPSRPPTNEAEAEAGPREAEVSDDEAEEESSRESPDAATLEQHRRLAIEVCQALAAAAAADPTTGITNVVAGSTEEQDSLDQYQEQRQDSQAAAAAALKRLDSINDSSPRACLWMRRSIARPIALDLTRKHRAARA